MEQKALELDCLAAEDTFKHGRPMHSLGSSSVRSRKGASSGANWIGHLGTSKIKSNGVQKHFPSSSAVRPDESHILKESDSATVPNPSRPDRPDRPSRRNRSRSVCAYQEFVTH